MIWNVWAWHIRSPQSHVCTSANLKGSQHLFPTQLSLQLSRLRQIPFLRPFCIHPFISFFVIGILYCVCIIWGHAIYTDMFAAIQTDWRHRFTQNVRWFRSHNAGLAYYTNGILKALSLKYTHTHLWQTDGGRESEQLSDEHCEMCFYNQCRIYIFYK